MSTIHGVDLSALGISKAPSSKSKSIAWMYFICIGSVTDKHCLPSLPVRVAPDKLEQFYSDFPPSDYLVFQVSRDTTYRGSEGGLVPISSLF